jgi:hypothetical protein
MKALSILQPWAWLIVSGLKDIENRSWRTEFRGRFLVHAGKSYTRADHELYRERFRVECSIILPPRFEELARGAIVGQAELVDCVRQHPSKWKDPHSWGFVLANAKALTEPVLYRGQLGFFEISHAAGVVDLFG